MALLYRPFHRRNPSLATTTPEGFLDIILGRMPEGHRAILLPYREILIPRVTRILEDVRAERQREVDTQLPPEVPTGDMVEVLPALPPERDEGGTKGTGLHGWEIPEGVPLTMARKTSYATVAPFFRKRFASFIGGPYTIKKQVEPSASHPGYLDARVTIKAGNGQDYARGLFTFVPEGERGPVGFVPHGVRILGTAQDGKEYMGELHWPLDDRNRPRDEVYIRIRPGTYGSGGRIDPDTWVQVEDNPEDAALAMALLVAGANAEACHGGDIASCLTEASELKNIWPPKARAKSGQYTPAEFKGAIAQIKKLPEIVAAYAYFKDKVARFGQSPDSGITEPPDIDSYFYMGWSSGYGQLPSDLQTYQNLQRIRTEMGDTAGSIDLGKSTLTSHSDPYLRITIPAFIQKVKKQADAVADILGQSTPEGAIQATQRWGVGYSYLGEALTRMGFPTLKEPYNRYWISWPERLLAGKATWADYLKAGVEHYRLDLWPPGTTKTYKEEYEVLRRFASAMDKATPGVFTHAPTRKRFLDQYGLNLHLDRGQHDTTLWIETTGKDSIRVQMARASRGWRFAANISEATIIQATVAGVLATLAIPFDAFRWPRMKERGAIVVEQEGNKPWPPVPLYGKPQDILPVFAKRAYRLAQYLLYWAEHPHAELDRETLADIQADNSPIRLDPYMAAGKQQAILELFYFTPALLDQFNVYIRNNQPLPLDLWVLYQQGTEWQRMPWGGNPVCLPKTIEEKVKQLLIPFDQLPTVLALTWDWINNYPQGTTDPKGLWIRQLLDLGYRDWPPKLT